MSDDRFKEARRDLIDKQDDEGEEGAQQGGVEVGDGSDAAAEEKTQMVNLDDLAGGPDGDEGGGEGSGGGGRRRGRRGGRGNQNRRGRRGGRPDSRSGGGRGRRGGSPDDGEGFSETQDTDDTGRGGRGQRRSNRSRPDSRSGGRPNPPNSQSGGRPNPPNSQSGGGRNRPNSQSEGRPNPPNSQSGGRPNQPNSQSGGRPNPPNSQSGGRPNQPNSQSGGRRNRPNSQSGGRGNPPASQSGGQPAVPDSQSGGRPNPPASQSHETINQRGSGGPSSQSGQQADVVSSAPPAGSSGSVTMKAKNDSAGGGDGGGGQGQQVFVPGDDDGSSLEEKTAFVNLNDFADKEPESTTFTPDEGEAGYEGSTQFVNIDSLQQGSEGGSSVNIAQDKVLRRGFRFTEEDIRHGDITLIFGRNGAGDPVILRRVWEGDADEMPTELRERINRLNQLDIPNLCGINGMLIAESGAWVALERPRGRRLSALLQQEGPQETERVVGWVRQIGTALAELHDQDIVYAHLNPKSVWIDQNDNAVLEPFDVVRLEDRGDLGQFGPPELNVHDNSRSLTQATDVYSLAAVTLAGLTGIPLHPERVAGLDSDKITKAVREAVIDAPRERTQSVDVFVEQLDIEQFSIFGDFDPRDLDIKVVAGVVFGLMFMTVGILSVTSGGGGGGDKKKAQKAKKGSSDKMAAQQKSGDKKQKGGPPAAAEGGETKTTGKTVAQPPGAFQEDARLTVDSSFRLNPPEKAASKLQGEALNAKVTDLRNKARDLLAESEEASDSEKRELLKRSLQNVTEAIRIQKKAPSPTDQKLLETIREKEPVREYRSDLIERIQENIRAGSIGEARFGYRNLSAIDPKAEAGDFFENVSSAKVETVPRIQQAKEESDDK